MDCQTRLFKLLDMLDAQGRIRVLARECMEFAPTSHNDGLFVRLGASLMIFFCGRTEEKRPAQRIMLNS